MVDQPCVIDDFIYSSPVVAIASRYPIVEVDSVMVNSCLANTLGLSKNFAFSRKVLRATIDVAHMGPCDCYVVHLKSKRSMIEADPTQAGQTTQERVAQQLKAHVAGSWGSTLQRGSEATLLMIEMIERRQATGQPMILMGDFNNSLSDGVLSHLLTKRTGYLSSPDRNNYLALYCLYDAWDLYRKVIANDRINEQINEQRDRVQQEQIRPPTHYFGNIPSVLDYILLSCEFDASYHDSLYQVSAYDTYEQHLINPIFERDGESTDHGIVLVTLTLRA